MPIRNRIYFRREAPWTIAEIKRFGKTPDSVLARRYGRTIKAVVAEREARGIHLPTGPRRWTAREIKLLGTMSDAELARCQSEHVLSPSCGTRYRSACPRRPFPQTRLRSATG